MNERTTKRTNIQKYFNALVKSCLNLEYLTFENAALEGTNKKAMSFGELTILIAYKMLCLENFSCLNCTWISCGKVS